MVKHPEGFDVILVTVDGAIHAYRNSCPHVGVGLDWGDGTCKTDRNELTCMMHGAKFLADTGDCIAGPCAGKALTRIAITCVGGKVLIT